MTAVIADAWKNLNDVTYNRSLQTVMSQPNTLYGNAVNNTTSVAVSSPYNTYTVLRTITFTTKKANTSFLLMGTAQVWMTDNSGFNIGFNYGGTMILGYNGSSGDSWMGWGNAGPTNSSYSRTRVMIHSPNVAANTSISYSLMIAKWGSSGTLYVGGNVGYQNGVLFSVTELEN